MKKALLGATAIAGSLLVAGVANAQTAPAITWSGFQYTYWVFVDEDFGTAASPASFKNDWMTTDTEVKIRIRGETADKTNYGAFTEFEADRGSTNNVDENWLWVENSGWGRIEFGDRSGPFTRMYFGTPINAGYDGGIDGTRFVASEPTNVQFMGYQGINPSKITKLTYYTPRIADGILGFGVSYAPTNNRGGVLGTNIQDNVIGAAAGVFGLTAQTTNIIEVAGNAIFKVGDGSLRMSAGWLTADYPSFTGGGSVEDFDAYMLGVNYQLGMMQIGAGYYNMGESGQLSSDPQKDDSEAISVGISYGSWGAYRVALQWLQVNTAGSTTVAGDDESTVIALSGDYHIFPGFMLWGEIISHEYEDESGLKTFGNYNDVLSFVIGAALNY